MDTLLEIRDNIKDALDAREEEWFEDKDWDKLINYAVRKANREIITLYEDYFLSLYEEELSSEQDSISYPPDVYANKIRSVMFTDAPVGRRGSYAIEIKSNRDLKSAIAYSMIDIHDANANYAEWIPYSALGDRKMKLVPSSGVAGHVQVWYIRKAKVLVNDDDMCDIPEFVDYVEQIAKTRYLAIDSDPRWGESKNEERELKAAMIGTLSNMKPDENTEVLYDTSHYNDSV